MQRVLLVLLVLATVGCKGKAGPAGASGTNGTNGSDATANVYTVRFTTGVAPTGSYAGTTWNRIDSANPTGIYTNDGTLMFANTSGGERTAILVRYNIAGLIPTNAVLRSAAIELVSTSSTSLSGTVTLGVHEVKPTSACSWTNQVNWNVYNGSGAWYTCSGTMTFDSNAFNGVMGSAAISTAFNSSTNRIGLTIATSTITDWLNGNNNGLAIVSENMGADASGTVVFASPTNGDSSIRPTLEINYTL